jgi:hypothetical protein
MVWGPFLVVAQVSESRGFTLRAVHSAAAPEVHKHKTELEGAREAYWQVSQSGMSSSSHPE